MRFEATRGGRLRPMPFPAGRPPSPAPRGLWRGAVWPGLRIMLKVLALPLTLFIGLPACLLTLACLLRGGHAAAAGQLAQSAKMFVSAWLCGTVAALAFWPRRNL